MTDLISSLAESIVALINVKPRSPTKAEIEEVLRPIVEADRTRRVADVAKFVDKARAAGWNVRDCQAEASSVSQAMLDAKDAIRKSSYEDEELRLNRAKALMKLARLESDQQRREAHERDAVKWFIKATDTP